MRPEKSNRIHLDRAMWFTAAVGLFAVVPLWAPPYMVHLLVTFFVYLCFAQMWNLLAGGTGLFSLGQQSFIGLGGYAPAILAAQHGLSVWWGIPAAGLIAALFAVVMSLVVLRLRGVYFAVATWIVAETLGICFADWSYVGYGRGLFITPAYRLSPVEIYYAAMVVGLGSVVLAWAVLRSDMGLALKAIRDDEEVAESVGVRVLRHKLACFVIAACVTGIGAAVLYLNQAFIQPYKAFGIDWTVKLLFIVIIGGMGTIGGPIVGAGIFILLQECLADWPGTGLLFLGVVTIVIVFLAPRGIVGTLGWGLRSARAGGKSVIRAGG